MFSFLHPPFFFSFVVFGGEKKEIFWINSDSPFGCASMVASFTEGGFSCFILYTSLQRLYSILTTIFPFEPTKSDACLISHIVISASVLCFNSRIAVISFSQGSISFQVVQSFNFFLYVFSLLDARANLVFVSLGGTRHEGLVQTRSEVAVSEGIFTAKI